MKNRTETARGADGSVKIPDNRVKGGRTLLASLLLSAPGPIVLGAGLLVGRSSTQIADFARRTAELAAIAVSFAVYRAVNRDSAGDDFGDNTGGKAGSKAENNAGKAAVLAARKARLEGAANLCVGLAMCLGGAAMAVIALLSGSSDKGNVIPGLVIAVLGVITNTWFWLRYRALDKASPDAILAAQSRLYRAKSLVDACVTAALAAVAAAPASAAAHYLDIAGTVAVSVYLLFSGAAIAAKSGIIRRAER